MKSLLLLVGVAGLVAGAVFLYKYLYQQVNVTDRSNLIFGGAFLLVALACFAIFFFKKFREEGEQDISITKF